jgi:DNA-3-methyladenine glycosylase II
VNAQTIEHLSKTDRALGRLIRKVGPCRLKPDGRRAPYAALVEAVAHQQLTGKAAQAILRRLKALFPKPRFPTPEDLLSAPDDLLREAGLSRAKVVAIKDIAAKTIAGIVPKPSVIASMSDEEIIERLLCIRGVGRWTVEMLLIFKLGRPDVWPVDDYGIRKGFALLHGLEDLPRPRDLLEHGERWRPYRTTAAWYLWRALDLERTTGKK